MTKAELIEGMAATVYDRQHGEGEFAHEKSFRLSQSLKWPGVKGQTFFDLIDDCTAALAYLSRVAPPVPVEATEEQLHAIRLALCKHIKSLPKEARDKVRGRSGGYRVAPILKAKVRYAASVAASPFRQE